MAQGIAGAEELSGHGLIDDDHEQPARGVCRLENPPLPDGDAHRRKVSRRHPPTFSLWLIARDDGRLSLNLEAADVFTPTQRQAGNRPDRARTRQCLEAGGQLLKKRGLSGVVRISRVRQLQVEHQHGIGSEAGLYGLHAQKAPNHETRRRQQYERKCHFRGDQPAAHALAHRTVSAATAFVERFAQIKSRRLERWYNAKHSARHQGHERRETQRCQIERSLVEA